MEDGSCSEGGIRCTSVGPMSSIVTKIFLAVALLAGAMASDAVEVPVEPSVRVEGLNVGAVIRETTTLRYRSPEGASATVTFWLNGEVVGVIETPGNSWDLEVHDLPYGEHRLAAEIVCGGQTYRQRLDFWYPPDVVEKNPPVGYRPGAREIGDGKVRFVLYAPGKKFVSLVGTGGDGDPFSYIMNQAVGGTWWVEVALKPGVYLYQYLVEGRLRLADPYSTDVEWKDENGREDSRPEQAMSRLQVGKEPFAWDALNYRRPAHEALVIYQLCMEDLAPGAGFTGVVQRLDSIRSLGFNAIQLLPMTEFANDRSRSYNPSFHFAPESEYGSPDDLKFLIQEAHRRGLAVLVDQVFSHMDSAAPLYCLYGSHLEASPYFQSVDEGARAFPEMRQDSPAARAYFADVISYWINEYKVDGFCYVFTKSMDGQNRRDWDAGWFANVAKTDDPSIYQFAAQAPLEPEMLRRTGMDALQDVNFRKCVRNMLVRGRLDARVFERVVDPVRSGYRGGTERVLGLANHDQESLMHDFNVAGYDDEEAHRRMATGQALLATCPGIPSLFSGPEFFEKTWSRDSLVQLLEFRATSSALRSDVVRMLTLDEASGVAVFQRNAGDSTVLVAVNVGRQMRTITLNLTPEKQWVDPMAPDTLIAGGQALEHDLMAGDFWILSSKHRLPVGFPDWP